jgi:flagellin-like hook-associated protein FlgL
MENLLNQMKSLASAAKTSDNVTDLEDQYNTVLAEVADLAKDSNYGGQNLTYRGEVGTISENQLSVDFNEYAAGTTDDDGNIIGSGLSVQGFSVNVEAGTGNLQIFGSGGDGTTEDVEIEKAVDGSTTSFSTASQIDSAIKSIDNFISQLRTEAQKLSSSLSTIQIRSDFTSEMVNTLNTGADNLTLADMNEEGANMLMLQTRQNLGTTSLSLASQAAQAVMRLF